MLQTKRQASAVHPSSLVRQSFRLAVCLFIRLPVCSHSSVIMDPILFEFLHMEAVHSLVGRPAIVPPAGGEVSV